MAYVIGIALAFAVSVFATAAGFDRQRAFYPTVLIVVATYYTLFAIMGGSMRALAIESAVVVCFIVLSVVGFKFNLWLVAIALAGHGVFDLLHGHLIANPGVPAWWPAFCMSYDVAAGAYLAMLLLRRSKVASSIS
jgi:hypothetical protein